MKNRGEFCIYELLIVVATFTIIGLIIISSLSKSKEVEMQKATAMYNSSETPPREIERVEYLDTSICTVIRWSDGTTSIVRGFVANTVPKGMLAKLVKHDENVVLELVGKAPSKTLLEAER
jgi:hypothetical protein